MTDPSAVAAIVGELSEAEKRDFTTHWDQFADADPLSHGRDIDAFLRDMEMGGFANCVPVDADALEDPFAWERGIEPNGMMWELSPLGLAVRQALLSDKGEVRDG